MSNKKPYLPEPGLKPDLRFVWRISNRRRHRGLFRILWINLKDLLPPCRPIVLP